MTIMLAALASGGADVAASSGTNWAPYFIGGGILLVLLALMGLLLGFGNGREHS